GQFLASNYVSVPLTDVVASLLSAAAVVLLLRVWQPVESPDVDAEVPAGAAEPVAPSPRRPEPDRESAPARTGGRPPGTIPAGAAGGPPASGTGDAPELVRDSRADVMRAYAPYAVIIVLFALANINAVKTALAKAPWTIKFNWPGLDILGTNGKPLTT